MGRVRSGRAWGPMGLLMAMIVAAATLTVPTAAPAQVKLSRSGICH